MLKVGVSCLSGVNSVYPSIIGLKKSSVVNPVVQILSRLAIASRCHDLWDFPHTGHR